MIEEVIDSGTRIVEEKTQRRVRRNEEMQQLISGHDQWLNQTGLGGALGTMESFRKLQELPQGALDNASASELLSWSITIDNTEYRWKLLQGGHLSTLCNRASAMLKSANIGPGERASAVLHLLGKEDTAGTLLKGARMDCADLRNSSFFHQDMKNASFMGADLQNTYFFGSDLSGVNFRDADLRGVKFWECNLTGANLGEADLKGAKFADATIMNSVFADFAQFDEVQFDAKDP